MITYSSGPKVLWLIFLLQMKQINHLNLISSVESAFGSQHPRRRQCKWMLEGRGCFQLLTFQDSDHSALCWHLPRVPCTMCWYAVNQWAHICFIHTFKKSQKLIALNSHRQFSLLSHTSLYWVNHRLWPLVNWPSQIFSVCLIFQTRCVWSDI